MTTFLRREFTGERSGPQVLITAGVHGDEFESIAAVNRLVRLFDTSPAGVPGFCGKLTLVPIVNEDAYRRGQRTGSDGLDLARVCPGRSDGSPTEQIARELSDLIATADFYIDLHTGGTTLSILPLVGYMLHADRAVLDAQRRMATAFGLPVVWGTTAAHEGRTLSVARDAGVPAIYAEYGGAATCDPAGVAAYVAGCQNMLGVVGCLPRTAPRGHVRHCVEDDRPSSGHLQVQNPSPADGLFEPSVRLGDEVAASDQIGVVFDPLSDTSHVVSTPHAGIVLALRTFPRVRQGESVCVLLELKPGVKP